jgi:transposase-like protein
MKIIKFDNEQLVERNNTTSKRMFMDNTSFSCPGCKETSKADFQGMIFRSMEFYCKKCGAFYKMVNPAFSPPPNNQ